MEMNYDYIHTIAVADFCGNVLYLQCSTYFRYQFKERPKRTIKNFLLVQLKKKGSPVKNKEERIKPS